MLQEFRHAWRSLFSSAGFTTIAVLTLALGIGGTSAMFAVVRRVVLDPLPFRDADRLLLIWGSKPAEGQLEIPFSQPDFEDLRRDSRAFESLAAWSVGQANVSGGPAPEQVQFAVVTANLLDVLSVAPAVGRGFNRDEDTPGAAPVALISHRLWQTRFGARPDAVGGTLRLDGRTIRIAGVLPRDFTFLTFPREPDVWLPLGADPSPGRRFARGMRTLGVIGRLRDGITPEQARTEGQEMARQLAAAYPRFNTGRTFRIVPLRDQVVRGVRPAALLLCGAVACVLLIACANIVALLMVRVSRRRQEFSVRVALGASAVRLFRLQLAETLLLGMMGGTGGLLVAAWLSDLLARMPFRTDSLFVPYSVPRDTIGIDWQTIGFTLVVTGAVSLMCAVAPALRAIRLHASDFAGGARVSSERGQRRLQGALVAGEIAAALVLLAVTGLLMRSVARLQDVDPGFRPSNVVSVQVALSRSEYREPARVTAYYEESLRRLSALPGASAAAAVEFLPLSGLDASTGIYIDGRPAPARADEQRAHYRSVSDGYFEAMGIRILEGRGFTARDREGSPRVAIVNESMAKRYWPGESPIGRRVALDFEAMRFFPDRPPEFDIASGMREIVGVAADVHHQGLDVPPSPELFVPYLQRPVNDMSFVLRTATDPEPLASLVQQTLRAVDPAQPVAEPQMVSSLVARSMALPRMNVLLLTLFAGVSVTLAVVGLYGLLAYMVSQRSTEWGIRMALGGQPRHIRRSIVREGAALVLAGVAVGLPASLVAGRILRGLLFGVTPTDPLALAGAIVAIVVAAAAGCYLPAMRATRIDPASALRGDAA